ncbi:glycosyltransferase [Clostridium autoethanogenum]|uniref:Glycosyltransferase n=1 Tax=Clostridium autoethanogenum DSM 10061 TaxID=1341692 RepID=A0ABN4BGS3_9CLOT|nr:glycosyltransferase [Clostridium autoethanogenum]AGY76822.1 glycosyltransferase [Clostridium autoethanogenum DSM 10061]
MEKSKIPKITKIINLVRIIKEFRYIKKKFKPDIIHAHVANGAGFYAVILGKLFKIPVIITEHSPSNLIISGRLSYYIVKYAYKNSKYNVCVSKHLMNELNRIYPYIKFDVIYNPIRIPKNLDNSILNNKQLGYINISFVSVFYDKYIKGMQYLLPAIKELKEKGYKILLHIVGDGKFQKYYIEKSKELNISDFCKFYGYCSKKQVFNIVNMSDFMVSSSLTETFGCAIAEALMIGKPVVITNSGGPEDFVNDKVGIIVKKESKEELVKGIEQMIRYLNDYDSSYISKYSKQKFEMDAITRKYMDIYEHYKLNN